MHNGIGRRIPHTRSARDFDIEGFPVFTVAAFTAAVHAVSGDKLMLIAKVHQSGHIVVHCENDRPAASAVAAVRAAGCHILFAVKRNGPVAALPGLYGNPGFVNKTRCHKNIL